MTQDKSREKSLLFLLSTVSRSLEASPENKMRIRESIATLKIQDSGDKWEISARLSNEKLKNIEITKDRFSFYPVKSAARYETNPAVLNKNSAQEVLLSLFAEFEVQVPGKKTESVSRPISYFLPLNLIYVSLFAILSINKFTVLASIVIMFHLTVTTSKHHFSAIRRWMLISGVAFPSIAFLALDKPDMNNFQVALSQVSLLYIFDTLIRVESNHFSKLFINIARLFAVVSSLGILLFRTENHLPTILMSIIVILGYFLLYQRITSSLRNLLVLFCSGLLIALVVAAVITNPLKLLLVPYLVYISIYEILFGDNRNPAKIAFGAVCLTI